MAIFIGLMSGTSMDGVDGVALRFLRNEATNISIEMLASTSLEMPSALREQLFALQAPSTNEIERSYLAGNALAELYADCVAELLRSGGLSSQDVSAIGAHGQTVRHQPALGFTVQLLNAALLAERTGIAVAYDFRSRDIAAGGQGAPLVPAFHRGVFQHAAMNRAIVNIGGIANVSIIPPSTSNQPVVGFDCGPGNALMDAWCEKHTGRRFDANGVWAASGQANAMLVQALCAHPFFSQLAPKSTGRDDFHLPWLEDRLQKTDSSLEPRDVQASLLALTVHGIVSACEPYAVDEMYVCGGGVANNALMSALAKTSGIKTQSTNALGLSPQWVEAAAFAWLAKQRLERNPGNLVEVTGARSLRVLGSLTT